MEIGYARIQVLHTERRFGFSSSLHQFRDTRTNYICQRLYFWVTATRTCAAGGPRRHVFGSLGRGGWGCCCGHAAGMLQASSSIFKRDRCIAYAVHIRIIPYTCFNWVAARILLVCRSSKIHPHPEPQHCVLDFMHHWTFTARTHSQKVDGDDNDDKDPFQIRNLESI